jgi:hypothetical protein
MGKAKGKTTGKEYLQGADGGGEVAESESGTTVEWTCVVSAIASDEASSEGEVRFTSPQCNKWAIAYRFAEPGAEAFGMKIPRGDVTTPAAAVESPDDVQWTAWLETTCPSQPSQPSDVEVTWHIDSGGQLVGGKAKNGAWYISPVWLEAIKTSNSIAETFIQTKTGSPKKMNTSGMLAFKQESGWPGMAVATTQLGFDTRPREFEEGTRGGASDCRSCCPGRIHRSLSRPTSGP